MLGRYHRGCGVARELDGIYAIYPLRMIYSFGYVKTVCELLEANCCRDGVKTPPSQIARAIDCFINQSTTNFTPLKENSEGYRDYGWLRFSLLSTSGLSSIQNYCYYSGMSAEECKLFRKMLRQVD